MEKDPFFDALLVSPQDYSLRMVYADWLEERGDSRGELLRLVPEMWESPVCSGRYRRLRLRRDTLCRGCDCDWLKAMLRLPFSEIRKKLEDLGRVDSERTVFASDGHQYRLHPP